MNQTVAFKTLRKASDGVYIVPLNEENTAKPEKISWEDFNKNFKPTRKRFIYHKEIQNVK